MGYPLAPHLRHAGSGAWFEPLSLSAAMPTRIGESISDEEKLAHLHEYVHYLQATTTFFGVSRFHTLWWSSSDFSALLSKPTFSLAEKQDFLERHREKLDTLEYLAVPVAWDIDSRVEEGPHYVDTGSRHVAVYAKALEKENLTRLFPLGAEALQESMAMAVERWYGYSEQVYQQAKDADNTAFNYAAGTEALRTITGWDYEDLWWLSITLSDIALDHQLPYYAFYYGAIYLKETYSDHPPTLEELPALYQSIKDAVYIEEAEEERVKLLKEIDGIIARSINSPDTFDKAFVSLLQNIREAFSLRQQRPCIFVEHLLNLAENPHLLEKFHLPCYRVEDRLITTSTDEDLINAFLFLIAQMHYMACFVDETKDKQCPFLDNHEQCTFARITECERAPWDRAAEDGKGCISRFVAHGLQHSGKTRKP